MPFHTSEEIKLFDENHIKVPQVKDTWALWVADNLEGNVALVEVGDILKMAQHYRNLQWIGSPSLYPC